MAPLFFHLTEMVFLHYLVKQETSLYLNAKCWFAYGHTKYIKISPGHS